MTEYELVHTTSGRRMHYRPPGSAATLCLRKVTPNQKHDRAHGNDAVCRRCIVIRDLNESKEATP